MRLTPLMALAVLTATCAGMLPPADDADADAGGDSLVDTSTATIRNPDAAAAEAKGDISMFDASTDAEDGGDAPGEGPSDELWQHQVMLSYGWDQLHLVVSRHPNPPPAGLPSCASETAVLLDIASTCWAQNVKAPAA